MATTILECPHCGNAARTTKVVTRGAKITCTRCRKQFPFQPADHAHAPAEEATEVAIDTIPLAELLASEGAGSPPPRGTAPRPTGRPPRQPIAFDSRDARSVPVDDDDPPAAAYTSVTNSRMAGDPLALAARSSKERLIGGKQVRFGDTRHRVGVVLFFVLLAAGYGGFLAFKYGMKYINDAGDSAKIYRERMAKGEEIKAKKKGKGAGAGASASADASDTSEVATTGSSGSASQRAPASAPAFAPKSTIKGVAGTPIKLGDWEVNVIKAELGHIDAFGPLQQLFITVRVTNLAPGPRKYRYWSKPSQNTVISNQNGTLIPMMPGGAPKEDDVRLEPKKYWDDVLVVDGGAANSDLDLALRLPHGQGGCVIHISPEFVTKTQ